MRDSTGTASWVGRFGTGLGKYSAWFEVAICDLKNTTATSVLQESFAERATARTSGARAYILRLGDAYFRVGSKHLAQGFANFADCSIGANRVHDVGHRVGR